jgi:hypothetical protein
MKGSFEFQKKLYELIQKEPELKIHPPPWNPLVFREVIWILNDFLSSPLSKPRQPEQISDFIDRYTFLQNSLKGNP